MTKDQTPEDIEDITTRYIHMFTDERDSDVVKRVHIRNDKNNETPFYLVSLIEHKSHIDYNVVMQVFRYMAFIWEDYEKEMEQKLNVC
ncbi:MAG: Rpn family recombination-promoting nuclease/putative transposase [Roseburia sp.]|nr:Rpn family recombination-promoting nuclease/putative transposase [Roseburia sp.]